MSHDSLENDAKRIGGRSPAADQLAAALAGFGRPRLFAGVPLERRLADGRRIASIDMLRGLAALLMLLDHTRFFFSGGPAWPTELGQMSAGGFAMSWITGLCAPVFVFLTGAGTYLRLAAGHSKRDVARFLATRGFLLITLDLSIVPLLKWFACDPHWLATGPLWAIGWSMMALAGMVFLRVGTVAIIGMAIVFLHNAFDGIQADQLGVLRGLWIVLHEPGVVQLTSGTSLELHWPLVPWIGVIACGFALGELYRLPDDLRRTMLLAMGANLLVWFLILRVFNFYGDPAPWSSQDGVVRSVMSFFNCTRFPPSLCHLLVTLGLALLLLGLFDREMSVRWQRLTVFGSVPLYFYLVHWPVVHLLAVGVSFLRDLPVNWLFRAPDPTLPANDVAFGRGAGWQPQFGVDLPTVFLIWVLVTVIMYPGCVRYAKLKFVRRPRWASYF